MNYVVYKRLKHMRKIDIHCHIIPGLDDGAAQYIASHLDQSFFDPLIVEDCGEEEETLLYKDKAFPSPPPATPPDNSIGFWGVVLAVIVALLILSFF